MPTLGDSKLDPPRTSILVPTWRTRSINISPFYSVSNFEPKTHFPTEVSSALIVSPRHNERTSDYTLKVSFLIVPSSSFTNHTRTFFLVFSAGVAQMMILWVLSLYNVMSLF